MTIFKENHVQSHQLVIYSILHCHYIKKCFRNTSKTLIYIDNNNVSFYDLELIE